jgi:two-component system NtrC family sensor kinase
LSDASIPPSPDEVAGLKAQVKTLERQLKRQKVARANAEWFLESYSSDAYSATQALRKALHESKKRERELIFLNRSASHLKSSDSGASFIFSAIESAVEFSDAYCGLAFITKAGKVTQGDDLKIWQIENGWVEASDFAKVILDELPLSVTEDYSQWCVNTVERPDNHEEAYVLHFMQNLGNGEQAWLALLTKNSELDEEMLYVLDANKHYLQFGIGYRSSKHEIKHHKAALSSMEKDQRYLQEKLITADKMAMLGQLAAGIAHEINNPIGYVRSNTSVAGDIFKDYQSALSEIKVLCEDAGGEIESRYLALENTYSLKESAEAISEMFEESSEGIERIIDIVKALRGFSYPSGGKRVAINITEAINSALRITNNLHKYKNKVVFTPPENDIKILGNAGQIQQVLVNLLTNAIYATDEGKCIEFHVEALEKEAIITLRDEGKGMSKEVIGKMFTPFFTTKPPGDGTGLGMSISLTIIEEHGGQFEVTSEINKGTTIKVRLPLA